MAEMFDPFAHLPEDTRRAARRHLRQLTGCGFQFTRFDTRVVSGCTHFVMYFAMGDVADAGVVDLIVGEDGDMGAAD
jgi:hypothetical protein